MIIMNIAKLPSPRFVLVFNNSICSFPPQWLRALEADLLGKVPVIKFLS